MVATILEIVGLCLVSFGIGCFNIPAGLIAAGLSCVVLGVSIERGAK